MQYYLEIATAPRPCQEFYYHLKRLLTSYSTGVRAIASSAKIATKSGNAGYVAKGLDALSSVFPVVGVIPKIVSLGLDIGDGMHAHGFAKKVCGRMGTDEAFNRYIDDLAIQLTLQYYEQLKQLLTKKQRVALVLEKEENATKIDKGLAAIKKIGKTAADAALEDNQDLSDAQSVAEYAATVIVQCIKKNHMLEREACAEGEVVWPASMLMNAIRSPKEQRTLNNNTDTSDVITLLKDIQGRAFFVVDVTSKEEKTWDVVQFFSAPGICVFNPFTLITTYYHDDVHEKTNTLLYGYRIGTAQEVEVLQLHEIRQEQGMPAWFSYKPEEQEACQPIHAETRAHQSIWNAAMGRGHMTAVTAPRLLEEAHRLSEQYVKTNISAAGLSQVTDNYLLFLSRCQEECPAFSEEVGRAYFRIATLLNHFHDTTWILSFLTKALSATSAENALRLIVLQSIAQVESPWSYVYDSTVFLAKLTARLDRLHGLLQDLTAQRAIEPILSNQLWQTHVPEGIKMSLLLCFNFAELNEAEQRMVLQQGCKATLALYSRDYAQRCMQFKRMVNHYAEVGALEKTALLYRILPALFDKDESKQLIELQAARNNQTVFNAVIENSIIPLLKQYEKHRQHARAVRFIQEINQCIAKHPVSGTASDALQATQMRLLEPVSAELKLTTYTATIFESAQLAYHALLPFNSAVETHQRWLKAMLVLMETIIAKQVVFLGTPPCGFSMIEVGEMSQRQVGIQKITCALVLAMPWEQLSAIEQQYFHALLQGFTNVIDHLVGWTLHAEENTYTRQPAGLHIDVACYETTPSGIVWRASYVGNAHQLAVNVPKQALCSPFSLYSSSSADTLLLDYKTQLMRRRARGHVTQLLTLPVGQSPVRMTLYVGNNVWQPLSLIADEALLNEQGVLRPRPAMQVAGNHTVLPFDVHGSDNAEQAPDMYIKLWPEFPGRSYKCAKLAERLVGGGIVSSIPHLLRQQLPENQTKLLCVECTELAKGKSLLEILEHNPSSLNSLSAAEFTKQLILSICLHLEDESPKNIFYDTVTQTLTKIDVERAFLHQVKRSDTNQTLLVKSILFCMDNMEEALDESVIRAFLQLDIYKELQDWLIDLKKENERHHFLFEPHIEALYQPYLKNPDGTYLLNSEGEKVANLNSSLVGMVFPNGLIWVLYERLLRMQDALRLSLKVGERLTGLTFLRRISPNVHTYYVQLFTMEKWAHQEEDVKNKHALAKFSYLTKGLYVGNTLLTRRTLLDTEGEYQISEIRNVITGSDNDPILALATLKQCESIHDKEIIDQLKQGNPRLLMRLQYQRREKFLRQLIDRPDAQLPEKEQLAVINVLVNFPFLSLTLTPFADVLDDEMLKRVIQEMGNQILDLNLAKCHRLTQKSLYYIAKYCLHLQKLEMSGMNLVTIEDEPTRFRPQKLAFPECAQLILRDCTQLKRIYCPHPSQFPNLRDVVITGCTVLETMEINTASVRTIEGLDTCSQLMGKNALRQCSWLVGLLRVTDENIYTIIASCITAALVLIGQPAGHYQSAAVVQEILGYFNTTLPRRIAESLPVLIATMQRERNPNVQLAIIEILGRIGHVQAKIVTNALRSMKNDVSALISAAVALALRQVNSAVNASPTDALVDKAEPGTPVEGLGQPILNPEKINALLQELSNPSEHVRYTTIEMLCHAQTKDSRENIFKALLPMLTAERESAWNVREMVVLTLKTLLIPNTQHLAYCIQHHTDKLTTRYANDAATLYRVPKAIGFVSPSCLLTLFVHVARGEQDEAEKILRLHPEYLLQKRGVTDHFGRSFIGITIFQYAVWALDWHMWKMIRKYLPVAAQREQIQELNSLEHGEYFDMQPLLNAYQKCIHHFKSKQWQQAIDAWLKEVGGEQRKLPINLLQEYCYPNRPFFSSKVATFTEPEFPRKLDGDISKLGVDFAFWRSGRCSTAGDAECLTRTMLLDRQGGINASRTDCAWGMYYWDGICADRLALLSLFDVRRQQRELMERELGRTLRDLGEKCLDQLVRSAEEFLQELRPYIDLTPSILNAIFTNGNARNTKIRLLFELRDLLADKRQNGIEPKNWLQATHVLCRSIKDSLFQSQDPLAFMRANCVLSLFHYYGLGSTTGFYSKPGTESKKIIYALTKFVQGDQGQALKELGSIASGPQLESILKLFGLLTSDGKLDIAQLRLSPISGVAFAP